MKCQATIEDVKNGRSYRGLSRGFTVPKWRPCSKEAVNTCGPLHLCSTHTRLCREGFISESGDVAPQSMIRDLRNKREKFEFWFDGNAVPISP